MIFTRPVHIHPHGIFLLSNNYGIKPPWGWSALCKENSWNRWNCPFSVFFFIFLKKQSETGLQPPPLNTLLIIFTHYFPNLWFYLFLLFFLKYLFQPISSHHQPPPYLPKHISWPPVSPGGLLTIWLRTCRYSPPTQKKTTKHTHTHKTQRTSHVK